MKEDKKQNYQIKKKEKKLTKTKRIQRNQKILKFIIHLPKRKKIETHLEFSDLSIKKVNKEMLDRL